MANLWGSLIFKSPIRSISFYKYSKPDTSLKLYKSLIQPHLEYASAVWSPHLAKDIKSLEDMP